MVNGTDSTVAESLDLPISSNRQLVNTKNALVQLSSLLRQLEPEDLGDMLEELDELAQLAKNLKDQAKAISTTYRTGGQSKFGCWVAKMVNNCGPYLYHVVTENGKQVWKYHGKVGSARALEARGGVYQSSQDEGEGIGKSQPSEVAEE